MPMLRAASDVVAERSATQPISGNGEAPPNSTNSVPVDPGLSEVARDGPTGAARTSLLLIDSRPLTRDCLVAALGSAGIGSIVAVGNVAEALQRLAAGEAFTATFINMSADDFREDSLLEVIAPLKSRLPHCPVLLLTERVDRSHAAIALKQKIRALLSSDMPLDLTIAAIRFVELGWMLFPADMVLEQAGFQSERFQAANATWHLTGRQLEVLDHLRTGMSNKVIALALNIRERTVKAHVKEIMRRFGVSNRTQIVALLNERLRRSDDDG